ncbi:MAG: hypothetical protein B7Z37_20265 [Verrucomicrobia bacterium 12-59-8]|nr:MAG: hypothetical protein B7Z37_20265 [Verrucomicrobia bacterium 12-59-8]
MEPYLGQICLFPYNFVPANWAACEGQLMQIQQNTALFSLLGTVYGGDGRNTFALPDLRSRIPLGAGSGPGLTPVEMGEIGGAETTTLGINQMPAHSHAVSVGATTATATSQSPNGLVPAVTYDSLGANVTAYGPADGTAALAVSQCGAAGGSQPLSIRNPYLGLRYCIALNGIFPSRS